MKKPFKTWRHPRARTVFDIVKSVLIGIILLIVINIQASSARQVQATKEISAQTKQIAEQINRAVVDLKGNTNKRLDLLNSHIDCIVELFTRSDRSNLTISNIESCQLRTNAQQSSVTPPATKRQSDASPAPESPKTLEPIPIPVKQCSILQRLFGGLFGVIC